ncbi:MAG: thiol:disulfide interchange protein DsbA/DsbL [Halioglobus sp.]
MIKKLLLTFSLLVFGLSCAAAEDTAKTYVVGTDYDVITPPIRTLEPGKIEVAEFFWYGCHHCFDFEPLIEAWEKNMPDDVSFRGIPAIWGEGMDLHAKAFYTAQALGVEDTMTPVLFHAMNVEHKRLASQEEIGALFVANGVALEDFNKAFNSFGVGSEIRQAVAVAKAAQMTGTPALMVNGKYLVTGRKAGTQADMLKVVDFLVEQERAAKAKK